MKRHNLYLFTSLETRIHPYSIVSLILDQPLLTKYPYHDTIRVLEEFLDFKYSIPAKSFTTRSAAITYETLKPYMKEISLRTAKMFPMLAEYAMDIKSIYDLDKLLMNQGERAHLMNRIELRFGNNALIFRRCILDSSSGSDKEDESRMSERSRSGSFGL